MTLSGNSVPGCLYLPNLARFIMIYSYRRMADIGTQFLHQTRERRLFPWKESTVSTEARPWIEWSWKEFALALAGGVVATTLRKCYLNGADWGLCWRMEVGMHLPLKNVAKFQIR